MDVSCPGGGCRVSASVLVLLAAACSGAPTPDEVALPAQDGSADPGAYAGRLTCVPCHTGQAASWTGSHHDLAMQPADSGSVLGDFDGSEFVHAGVTSTFYRQGNRFRVRTDGPEGKLEDYDIAYTYGVEPLQQYLIEFPDGRIQALGICWDTRPAEQGGQRWFHLYPDDEIDFEHPLHWTGAQQNWNYMCSECHSTDLKRNYRAAEDRYETTWSEIDVSCEACHGPGADHVAWARQPDGARQEIPDKGLAVVLRDVPAAAWVFDPGARSARRDPPRQTHVQVEACARCHARRVQLTEDYRHGRPLADTHRVTLLDEPLYHADGQILDEVYVYGSFIQSRMYHEGVTCTDCHDPHTNRLHLDGNATCTRCHRQDVFDSPEHHFHEAGQDGSACVDCHMPAKDYMVVDPRRDHSFRIPRPDLSIRLGTPNACTACHDDRNARWAADQVAAWYGAERSRTPHYGEALHAARNWQPGAGDKLVGLVDDPEVPAIVRATALSLLPAHPSPGTGPAIARAIRDDDPLVRRAAVGGLEGFQPADRVGMGAPALEDPVRSVRLEAAYVLAGAAADRSADGGGLSKAVGRALDEYRAAQHFNAERAESHLNLGWVNIQLGRLEAAERDYRKALEIAPDFAPATINLADLYRFQGRDAEAEPLLRAALAALPNNADLHHALGLLLVRQKRVPEALAALGQAADLAPNNPRYAYVFGVALHSEARTADALTVLEQAVERFPGHMGLRNARGQVLNLSER